MKKNLLKVVLLITLVLTSMFYLSCSKEEVAMPNKDEVADPTKEYLWAYYDLQQKVNQEGIVSFMNNEPITSNPLILRSIKDSGISSTRTGEDFSEEELDSIFEEQSALLSRIVDKSYTWKEFFETGNGRMASRRAIELFYGMLNLNENDSIFSTNNAIDESFLFTRPDLTTRVVNGYDVGTVTAPITPSMIINDPNLTLCEKEALLDGLAFTPSNKAVVSNKQMELEKYCFRLYKRGMEIVRNDAAIVFAGSFISACASGWAGAVTLIGIGASYIYKMSLEGEKYDNCVAGRGYNNY